MHTKTASILVLLLLSASFFSVSAETVKDRAGAVLEDRSKMQGNSRWIYNNWRQGFEESKETGKPLMVVLRCVPCLACMGIDAGVLTDSTLAPLLNQFVRVRVINANALDLTLFQFDYDLSFSAIFFNGDGTVYGRFGSWTHQKNPQEKDTAAFREALEGALELHKGYPGNKDQLKAKQGRAMPVNDPLELPELAGKYKRELDWDGKVVQSCVHCHQVGDGVRALYRKENKVIPPEWIYPMPAPEVIGLTLSPDQAAHVEGVAKDSAAARAGIKPGDELVSLSGQSLISVADVSWALQNAPDSGSIAAEIRRDGEIKKLTLPLPDNWRLKSDISRRVGTWPMRAMATGGLLLEDLPAAERKEQGIAESQMALFVKHAGQYGEHGAAKRAGFQNGDIIVELDGDSKRLTESELIGRFLKTKKPGTQIKTKVLRGKEQIELLLPIQ